MLLSVTIASTYQPASSKAVGRCVPALGIQTGCWTSDLAHRWRSSPLPAWSPPLDAPLMMRECLWGRMSSYSDTQVSMFYYILNWFGWVVPWKPLLCGCHWIVDFIHPNQSTNSSISKCHFTIKALLSISGARIHNEVWKPPLTVDVIRFKTLDLPSPEHKLQCIRMPFCHKGSGALYQGPGGITCVVSVPSVAVGVLVTMAVFVIPAVVFAAW